ncbi:MAG: hypothetical protein AAFO06_02330 [Cyanobacteria bacterium J06597_16]
MPKPATSNRLKYSRGTGGLKLRRLRLRESLRTAAGSPADFESDRLGADPASFPSAALGAVVRDWGTAPDSVFPAAFPVLAIFIGAAFFLAFG